LKLNGTNQLLVYADVNICMLGGSVHMCTIEKSTEALVVTSTCKKNGLDVIADETKNVVMSRDQNAVRSYNIKTESNSFARVEDFIFGNNLNKSKFWVGYGY
jgi:hypothetical protein